MRYLFCLFLVAAFATPAHAASVWLEEMTWPEIRDALKDGKTTAIIPTGGTEQNGPHLVLGKHNFILQYTAMTIAERLGNALVAPILPYVPEGDISPPTGHMRFPGTLSLSPGVFEAVVAQTAASLKQHGFKLICLIGEHGQSQGPLKEVADKLTAQWQADGVRVLYVGDYYDEHNGQVEWMRKFDPKEQDIEAHGGFADTSEMLAVHPLGVREKLRAAYTPADMDTTGADGSALRATRMVGAKLVDLKVQGAVKEIMAALKAI